MVRRRRHSRYLLQIYQANTFFAFWVLMILSFHSLQGYNIGTKGDKADINSIGGPSLVPQALAGYDARRSRVCRMQPPRLLIREVTRTRL